MNAFRPLVVALLLSGIAGCSSDNGPSCSLKSGTSLAETAWPKFLADEWNTGRSNVDLSINEGNGNLLFPPSGQKIGTNETTPILGNNIYVGSSDTNVYVITYEGEQVTLTDQMQTTGPITGSPLLGLDGVLFVPTNGALTQFNSDDGSQKNSAPLPGFAAASPNIWNGDGTTYVGTLSGSLTGVCPNGVQRYQLSFPITQSPAAIAQDPNEPSKETPIIVAAGLGGLVRAYNVSGRQRWSFFAAATVNAAVLIDPIAELFYVADASGRVFSGVLANGTRNSAFGYFKASASIAASPVLGRDDAAVPSLYVADVAGTLYALDRASGAVRWTVETAGRITASPAVAIGGASDIVVVAVDLLGTVDTSTTPVPIGGRVYAIRDDGTQGTILWQYDTGASIGSSSPAINFDGTIYVGRSGLSLGTGPACPSGTGTCQVSRGGGVYAIGPAAPVP